MASLSVDDVADQLAQTKVDSKFELSFKGKGLKLDKAEDAKDIVDTIEKCEHMTALRLEGNTVGVDAAEAIARAIGKHSEFERALWSDMFTGRLKTEIPHALKHLGVSIMGANCKLVEIDLSDNAFGPNGVVGLVDLLKSPSCYSLQELKLNNNGLGIGGGKMLAECLTECHKSSLAAGRPLALKVFISGRNRLENDGAKALAAAFKVNLYYVGRNTSANLQRFPGMPFFRCFLFFPNSAVKLLLKLFAVLCHNVPFCVVPQALPKLTQLEIINFGDCLVRTDGARAIANVLNQGHKQLKELILSGNEITKPGALDVVESLEGKSSLINVDLNANSLGEEGCEEVRVTMDALGLNDALASLSDDEGSDEDDEEEEEDDGDDDYGEDEEPEEERDGDISSDPKLQVQGSALTPNKPQISVKDFLAFPSPTKLLQLGHNSGDAILEELGEDKTNIDKVVAMILKVSLVVSKDDEAKIRSCECADGLLQNLFNSLDKPGPDVANAFLVALGLIKGEDKKMKAPGSIVGPLLVLEHIVRQPYFPSELRQTMLAFLSKPHPLLEKASDARHKILQTLYSF
ncbi:ran GTPase-activating protein 1 [Aplysia californica]|uniref:Ran GTPase-activating protein 1 n=1 Tax=Aplysia californica TaxID=6500 RepID=A0ABM1VS54_APLCA|nr:ran GTPase-activating protein 1 [Aplysia californica]